MSSGGKREGAGRKPGPKKVRRRLPTVDVSKQLGARVDRLAETDGISVAEVVRLALTSYLDYRGFTDEMKRLRDKS